MRLLVCGGRDYADDKRIKFWLDALQPKEIVHGCARGADTLASWWAADNDVKQLRFPAEWEVHGRAAGFIRNQQMLDTGKPDAVIAFPGGRGTAHMVSRARAADVPVIEVRSRYGTRRFKQT